MDSWFDDTVLGKLPPHEAMVKPREVGEDDVADMLEMTQEAETKSFRSPGSGSRGWLHLPRLQYQPLRRKVGLLERCQHEPVA